MKAIPIENQNPPTPQDDKETLGALIDLMGQLDGGIENEDFKELKEVMMNSGITTEGLISLLGDNFAEAIIRRPIIDVMVQKLTETAQFPTYSHLTDACADIYADEDVIIKPGETHAVSTGLAFAIPEGHVIHVYARSGLSLKSSIRLANSVGIIDAGYRDELKILLWNSGKENFHVEKGMRIAQMDIMQSPAMEFYEVENVKDFGKDRKGGFGSSGLFEMEMEGANG
jgi:dUTP pyrophosphatase